MVRNCRTSLTLSFDQLAIRVRGRIVDPLLAKRRRRTGSAGSRAPGIRQGRFNSPTFAEVDCYVVPVGQAEAVKAHGFATFEHRADRPGIVGRHRHPGPEQNHQRRKRFFLSGHACGTHCTYIETATAGAPAAGLANTAATVPDQMAANFLRSTTSINFDVIQVHIDAIREFDDSRSVQGPAA